MSGRPPVLKKKAANKDIDKVNVYDAPAVKLLLDTQVSKVLSSKSYSLNMRLSNLRILLTGLGTLLAVIAQFYPAKFPENWWCLMVCCPLFVVVNALVTYWLPAQEQDIIAEVDSGRGQQGFQVRGDVDTKAKEYWLAVGQGPRVARALGDLLSKDGELREGCLAELVEEAVSRHQKEGKR